MSKESRPVRNDEGAPRRERQAGDAYDIDGSQPHEARWILARAAVILKACGEVPALLDEVLALEANVEANLVSDDIAILLLESALYQHLPGVLDDQREWARELGRLAGV